MGKEVGSRYGGAAAGGGMRRAWRYRARAAFTGASRRPAAWQKAAGCMRQSAKALQRERFGRGFAACLYAVRNSQNDAIFPPPAVHLILNGLAFKKKILALNVPILRNDELIVYVS